MAQEIVVPDLGDFHDVEVIDVLVKPGDKVEKEVSLLTLETEKATMDVPSPGKGVVSAVLVKKGDRVSKGTRIVVIEDGSAASATPAAGAAPAQSAASAPPAATASSPVPPRPAAPRPEPAPAARPPERSNVVPLPAPANSGAGESDFSRAHASPSVRKFARELGVDIARIKGTGLKERVTHDDVKAWVKRALVAPAAGESSTGGAALPKVAEVDFAKFGPVEIKPLGRIQKISGRRLQASWLNVPHVWQMDEADITEMEEARQRLKVRAEKEGIKLTPLAFILRACAKALDEFPILNASLDATGENLVYKRYINLGFAADTPNGLVVPVIRDAGRKDIYELAADLSMLSAKARDGKLAATDMQGGSFTVSSLGGIGGTAFTPIINAPEVAILGVARSSMQPVYKEGAFVPRLMLPFTLAYDHRVIDGALAVRFTTHLAKILADANGLLEAVPKRA